jgi:kelch-like protein 10
VYDPDSNEWTFIKDMSIERSGHCCIAFHGCVYAIGGYNGHTMSSAEKYNPKNNTWSPIADMNYARTRFAIAVIEDKIYVIGGCVDVCYRVADCNQELCSGTQTDRTCTCRL